MNAVKRGLVLGLATLLAAPVALSAPISPGVGGRVLLTGNTVTGPEGHAFLAEPFLTDARGHGVERAPWMSRPLQVIAETGAAFRLSDGRGSVWLPKRNLAAKAVFPLTRDAETRALAAQYGGRSVWFSGSLSITCRPADGYTVLVGAQTARVVDVWRVQATELNLSPKGGLVDAEMVFNEQLSSRSVLVVLDKLTNLKQTGMSYGGPVVYQTEGQIRELVLQRCTTLPGLYASADDVRRNLSLTRPARRSVLPTDPDQAERALVGWTRAQVLAQYGSPNEPGRLDDVLKLPAWTYGEIPYNMVLFKFGPDGRVRKASIARSP